MDLSIESRCIHLEHDHGENRFGAISFPIYQTATFSHPGLGESTGYDYTRMQNSDKGTFRKDGGCVGKKDATVWLFHPEWQRSLP